MFMNRYQNVVYTHNGTYFSYKRNEILIHAIRQMNLENMLNEKKIKKVVFE